MSDDTATLEADVEEARAFWDEAVDALEGKAPKAEKAASPQPKAKEAAPEPQPEPEQKEPEGDSENKSEDEPESEPESPDEEAEAEDADPWEEVPDNLRKEFQSLQEKNKDLEHKNRSISGRLGAFQKKIDELSRKLEGPPPAKDEKIEATEDPVASIFDSPEWKKFEADFGDEVAGPQKAAMRRLFEVLHSRIQATEGQAKSLTDIAKAQELMDETQKLEVNFKKWASDHMPDTEYGESGWFKYVQDNYDDLEAFSKTDENAAEWWANNYDGLAKPGQVFKLIKLFEADRPKKSKTDKPAPEAKKGNGASPKPEPRPRDAKREAQLKSAASPAPRSAPGPGSRSDDLPDPEAYGPSFEYFAAKAPTR